VIRFACARCGPDSLGLGNESVMPADHVQARAAETLVEHIVERLKVAGVAATVLVDRRSDGSVGYLISDVPRGRRPTVLRVMREFAVHWR
jgi:hypothetical protein